MSENNEPILPAPSPESAPAEQEIAVQGRRTFLQSLGKWSGAAILAVVGTSWLSSASPARAGGWVNRGGGGGGGWINRRGGWVNGGGGGGVWVNGGGGGWVNGGGGWINGGGGGGGWVNRRGGGGSWVNRW
ncbi:MAG: hypothetical protein ACAI35_01200 [Candidatus Methylacidiphilales bacterium]|nr:hypothetical protein [Candidatus Methylacidiphilales bacterium]